MVVYHLEYVVEHIFLSVKLYSKFVNENSFSI